MNTHVSILDVLIIVGMIALAYTLPDMTFALGILGGNELFERLRG